MSFTSNVKNEVCLIDGNKNEKIAELSAIVRNNSFFDNEKIDIVTENSKVAKRIYLLFKELYNINPSIEDKENSFNRNRLYIVKINERINSILSDLSVVDNNFDYLSRPKNYIIDNEEEKRAYLKGVFLVCGSINDPKTSRYHLEFFINNYEEALYLTDLLNEFYLNSKITKKEKKYMVYVKEAEKNGDFLRIIGANNAVMYYEDIRIYRDHKNMTNRLNNMEQANIDKIIATCNEQINDINIIIENDCRKLLDDKINEAIDYRLKYPESSLQELSEIISLETGKTITKSGLNHRFRKIKDFANKLKMNK